MAGKGRVAPGFDADFLIADLRAEKRVDNAAQASLCGWTPYDGEILRGWPVATFLRGRLAAREGQIADEAPQGRAARFFGQSEAERNNG